jgi:hypothetical protein
LPWDRPGGLPVQIALRGKVEGTNSGRKFPVNDDSGERLRSRRRFDWDRLGAGVCLNCHPHKQREQAKQSYGWIEVHVDADVFLDVEVLREIPRR